MNSQNSSVNSKIAKNDFKAETSYRSEKESDRSYREWFEKRDEFSEEKRELEEKTLESSQISLGLINESEDIGLNTANALIRQRDKLDNVEDKLDSMNHILKVNQKHLTSIKSIFGGFKNYFSRNNDKLPVNNGCDKSSNNSEKTLDPYDQNLFINTIEDNRSNSSDVNRNETPFGESVFNKIDELKDEKNSYKHEINNDCSVRSRGIEGKIEQNLNEIDSGVERLRNLSLKLGNEIDSQNSLIERITKQAEKNELTVKHQNNQMRQILKK